MDTDVLETNEDRHIVKRRGENVFGAISAVVLGVLVNMVPGWDIGFLTPAVSAVIPAVTISLVVQGASNLSLAFYSPRYLHHALHAVMAGFSLNAARVIYEVYPFDFSAIPAVPVDTIVTATLIVGMVASGISIVVNGIRFLFAR
ncbi:MAG: hypothetical protein ACLFO1_05850, partial [Spirochaetaceae bacterium]